MGLLAVIKNQYVKQMQKEYLHVLMEKARGTNYRSSKSKMSAKNAFLNTEKELRRLNTSFRNKKVSDDLIANNIFKKLRGEITDSEIDLYANNHFTAGYYSFLDLKNKMIEENIFDYRGVKKYGYLINLILYDILIFANHIGQKIDKDYYFFQGGKSNIEDSRWHYLGTFQLLYNSVFEKKMLDDKFALILSAVSLRQTIELKMQRILGFAEFIDLNGQKVFTKHNFFFDFIKKNKSHFEFDVNIKIIQKIFEFCNESVHKGVMPYYWQMNYAIKFCDPLFYDTNHMKGNSWSINGSIKISRYLELKEKLEKKLKEKFSEPEFDIELIWIKPEAQIMDKK